VKNIEIIQIIQIIQNINQRIRILKMENKKVQHWRKLGRTVRRYLESMSIDLLSLDKKCQLSQIREKEWSAI
jgi:hypothetical protein